MLTIIIIITIIIIFFFLVPLPKSSPNSFVVSTKGKESIIGELTGVHVNNRISYISNFCKKGDVLKAVFEPDNKYDSNAIEIFHDNFSIGYISALENEEIGDFMREYEYICFIHDIRWVNTFLYVDIAFLQK